MEARHWREITETEEVGLGDTLTIRDKEECEIY